MKIYNPNREERAFLYQEAQELAPLMKDLGSLSVMVEESQSEGDLSYRVTFMVAPESVGMKVQATDHNLYEATIAARNEAQRQLNTIVNSIPKEARPGAAAEGRTPSELLH